jgi:putative Mn2+ efflux pump MntP
MGWISLLALATALAMDAFAVAIVAGLALKISIPNSVRRQGWAALGQPD